MSEPECIICLESLTEDDKLKPCFKTRCGHYFHRDCLIQWLDSSAPLRASCPMCRRGVSDPRFKKRLASFLRKVWKGCVFVGKCLLVLPILIPVCCCVVICSLIMCCIVTCNNGTGSSFSSRVQRLSSQLGQMR